MNTQFSYQSEKLSAARKSLMLPHPQGEARGVANAFQECMHAFHDLRQELLDDDARRWVRTIQDFMDTAGIDDAAGRGTFLVKAEQLTADDLFELSRAVDELAYWFDRHFWEVN